MLGSGSRNRGGSSINGSAGRMLSVVLVILVMLLLVVVIEELGNRSHDHKHKKDKGQVARTIYENTDSYKQYSDSR